MVVTVNKDEKFAEKKLFEKVKTLIEELRSKEVGARINTNIDKELINKFFILLENDGLFVDIDNRIVIWDKKTARKYNEQITSICRRNCSRTDKGNCCGCREYLATTKLNSFFLKEEIVLAVA